MYMYICGYIYIYMDRKKGRKVEKGLFSPSPMLIVREDLRLKFRTS